MSFSDFYISRRPRKGNFLNQIGQLIDWQPIEREIRRHYAPVSDVVGRPAYPGLLLFKMLLVGLWHGGLSDQAVGDMANVNLQVLCFLGLSLEDEVPDHSVLSRFRTKLTQAQAWDGLLSEINRQIEGRNLMVKSVFGYKQHTLVDGNGLVVAVETTPANRHDSQAFLGLVDKAGLKPGSRVHADKAYPSKKHRDALKARGVKNGIQDKAVKNKPLSLRQLARNSVISKVRFVVERTLGGQQRWFAGKTVRYRGLAKAHAWHILLAVAYNLRRLPRLYVERLLPRLPQGKSA